MTTDPATPKGRAPKRPILAQEKVALSTYIPMILKMDVVRYLDLVKEGQLVGPNTLTDLVTLALTNYLDPILERR